MTPERLEQIRQSYDRAHKQVRTPEDELDWYNNGHNYIQELWSFANAMLKVKK